MSWPLARLDQLGYVSRGRSRHRPRDAAHLYGGPFPFIQTGDVKHSRLYITEYTQTYSEAGLAQSRLWPVGTLCITIAANIADTSILGIEACFPDSVIGFIPNREKADARFIKYSFDALLQRQYQNFSKGAAQDNLSQEKLLSIDIPVPTVELQTTIADVLANYDALIENNRRRVALLEQAARFLYEEWFVCFRFPGYERAKFNNGLPKGWKRMSVEDAAAFMSRGITPVYDDEASCLVVNQKCVRGGRLETDLARRQSKKVPEEKLVQFGDVLINSTGEGTLGRVAQVLEELGQCTVDSHLTIVRPKPEIGAHLFGMAFKQRESYLSGQGRGATNQTELSKDTIGALTFDVPPPELSENFETKAEAFQKAIVTLVAQNRVLASVRDLLLPRLMSGEVEV
jgi:type I restriction enzyme S subunit